MIYLEGFHANRKKDEGDQIFRGKWRIQRTQRQRNPTDRALVPLKRLRGERWRCRRFRMEELGFWRGIQWVYIGVKELSEVPTRR
jgi:hypothetical protein